MITPLMPVYARADIALVEGKGSYVFDDTGKKYLDYAAGIGVNCLGHGHPHLVKALQEQANKLWHTSNLYRMPLGEKLAKRLTDATFADTVFFCNSGAEAWELSIKIAKSYQTAQGAPQKYRAITCSNAFHGRTIMGIAATDQEKLRKGFEPLPDHFTVIPFNDVAALERAVDDSIGAINFETVQGEGGFTAATPDFIKTARALCDKHDLLLVLDEIQCGTARSGKMFAFEHYDITPDVISIAKGIGGGFPLGACLATEKAAKGMVAGTHGSTYGGNPLAMAVGNAVLDILLSDEFLAEVTRLGERLTQSLMQLIPNHPDMFRDEPIRGMGLMRGIGVKVPSREFVNHARSAGIMTVAAGQDVVRLLPPLNTTDAEIAECVEKLSLAARTFKRA